MAALDKLFRVLVLNGMDALVMRPGEVPCLMKDGVGHPAIKTVLAGSLILDLLNELPEARLDANAQAGETRRFTHQWEDAELGIDATWGEDGWSAHIAPLAEPVPATDETTAASADSSAWDLELDPIATDPGDGVGPVVRLLEYMLEKGASDLHLSAGQAPRIRLHGDLVPIPGQSARGSEEMEGLLSEITPPENRQSFADSSDTDFAYEIPGKSRFRVNLFRDHRGAGAVIREIPFEIPTFEQLQLPDSLRNIADLSKGLVLVTGPTGSGKSTTLAALVDLINRSRADHIITIEDPIEFVHPSRRCLVNQREVGVHTASFGQALRAALREDPDIVLVGEMRDLETTSTAIETAETGHLVFGTLHTTTAASTVERLIDQFPADRQGQIRTMLAQSLHAVVAQMLLKKIGGGRVAAFEVLIASAAVANLIREGKTFQIASAMQTGRAQGMQLLNDSLLHLVKTEQVEPREAFQKAVNKTDLLARFQTERIRFDPQHHEPAADRELQAVEA